jgi:hypothetical protein
MEDEALKLTLDDDDDASRKTIKILYGITRVTLGHELISLRNRLDKYWAPLKLALHPLMPARVRAGALDSLQRLAAHQLLRGSLLSHGREEETLECLETSKTPTNSIAAYFGGSRRGSLSSQVSPESLSLDLNDWDSFLSGQDTIPAVEHTELLIDDMIHTLCSCFSISNSADDPLQLSVIKVLLTLLTSPLVEIHGASLIKVMQTLFHIHSLSKHPVHISTAKASLTQMMNVVVARMERVVSASATAGHAKVVLLFIFP